MKDKEKDILRAKLKRSPKLMIYDYSGYLTTVERLYILERTQKLDEYELLQKSRCQEDIKSGAIRSCWFYFKGNKNLKDILPIIKKNDLHKGLKK